LAAPAERAWSLLVDWPRQGDWMPATTVRVAGTGSSGAGTRLRAVTGVGPLRIVDTMEITDWDPPARCVTRHTGRVLRGEGIFEIRALSTDRCRLTWTEDVQVLRLLDHAPVGFLARRLGEPFLARALARFARILANSTPSMKGDR
jgi:hypothetical protein